MTQFPSITVVGLAIVALTSACEVTTGSGAGPRYPSLGPHQTAVFPSLFSPPDDAPPGPRSSLNVEAFGQAAEQLVTAPLFLPGATARQFVTYQVVDGMAVMEGDIELGPAESVALRYALPRPAQYGVKGAVALSANSYLWPKGEIPYVIDASVSAAQRKNIQWAIAHVNETELTVRPRSNSDNDYVVFRDSGSGCRSYLGRIGGAQNIQLASCGRGSIIHEILHAAGFYHEQSRGDRDEFVTIMWDEISPGHKANFEKRGSNGQDIGAYDYSSIMHYSAKAFSSSGAPTIVTKKTGAKIGQREGLSNGDKAAIAVLYGSGTPAPAPPAPTPTTTPPAPTPTTAPPTPTPAPPTAPAPTASWNGSFAGEYTSNRGNVSCKHSGASVSCQYPGGLLLCTAQGAQLNCWWSGGGQGRALFTRRSDGVVAGTYGDQWSAQSRGKWELIPTGGGTAPTTQPAPTNKPPPTSPPPAKPPAGGASLSGNYSSTRGPMACTESPATLTCSFSPAFGVQGRLDCNKDASGLHLSCGWTTFFPQPGTGRAVLSRKSTSERNLSGTWGYFFSHTGGGTWTATGQ